ncbi:MAG: ribonuclease HII [Elusimicrobiota bacterium]
MPSFRFHRFDEALRSRYGVERLVGVDEAGRGPLAGPVVAAAVVLPPDSCPDLEGVRDSKRLAPSRREALFLRIRARAVRVGVGWSLPEEIDDRNILQATFFAMRRALARMCPGELRDPATLVVVDGDKTIPGLSARQESFVAGDDRSLCVASAGIVAKVVRDRWMRLLDRRHPGYGFGRHKGYGTAAHFQALERLGPCGAHRRSFLRRRLEPAGAR